MNPSLRRITVEQMSIVTQKFIEEINFLRRKAIIELPLIRRQHTSGGIKSVFFRRSFKMNLYHLDVIHIHHMGMYDLCFVCQSKIRIHHIS